MKTSVIIVTYNRPDYLHRVIEGYLHQTTPPGEILIADDGSTSDTADMIKSFQKQSEPKIIHIWHEDTGFKVSQIRNKAIAQSSGEYLIVCDDDSVPCPTMVEDHLEFSEPGYFIQGHRVLIGKDLSKHFSYSDITPGNMLRYFITGMAKNILNSLRFPGPRIQVSQNLKGIRSCNMSFFKKDFIAVNGFNEDFIGWGKEDSELVTRYYKYGLKRKDLKFRACCYHLHHEQYSRDRLDQNIALLEKARQENNYFCKNGINKYLTP